MAQSAETNDNIAVFPGGRTFLCHVRACGIIREEIIFTTWLTLNQSMVTAKNIAKSSVADLPAEDNDSFRLRRFTWSELSK